ncbi:MAG TPA: hypothetical protein VFK30_07460, partial [Anaerolineae bacterium]|nr:hypothetical protein [Anaerolineae bacterium]
LITLPAFWDTVRHRKSFIIKWIALAVGVGLGAYLYLLLRSLMHASWMWGDPSTPAGFWGLMSGGTYLRFFDAWPTALNGWLDIIRQVGQPWIEMITWPMAVLGTAGLIVMLIRRQFRYALGLIFVGVACFLFAITVQGSFPGQRIEDVPALLQPTVIVTLLGFAYLCHTLGQRSIWLARGGVGVALSVSVVLGVQNQPFISRLTHDTTGRDIISAAQKFVADAKLPAPAGFFAPWGGEFWALAYGQDVEQSIPNFELLPNRAKLADALNHYSVLYTFEHTLFNYNLAWWEKHLGNPAKVYLSSAGDDVIAISAHPLLSESDLVDKTQPPSAMGASILLRSWTVTAINDRAWQVTLYWQALTQPDRDYSVFVHASDQPSFDSPEAIVAQADTNAPVYGWYPTTLWSPGEIIRDDHIITAPADRRPTLAAVGLYYQDEAGAFHNLGQKIIPIIP